ncbi:MAG TPA: S9 family peptidase [Steroidobacteraceae bacterium]|nr:S9 family peptidase [Steroidobacteraceae bacterium]
MKPIRPFPLLLVPLFACAQAAQAVDLPISRIFSAPDLSGPSLRAAQISPDGQRVTFLRGKADRKDKLDLWEYEIRSGKSRVLVDSSALVGDEGRLSDEELQRRERQRISSLSGIVEYLFAPDGQALLFPLGGDLFYYDLRAPAGRAVRRLTQTAETETDAKFSPLGHFVSFIRAQNLFLLDLATGRERALTTDGGGPIKNGMAEFIAQEEMGRSTGYWWSPDEQRIAYARVDESPVPEVQRSEINADEVSVFTQRYPAAGSHNVLIDLESIELKSGGVTHLDLGSERDIYLARVDWFADARHVAAQRQSRDQRRLDLLKVDAVTGKSKVLLTETSTTWVDLNDELTFLSSSPAFIWASSRTGYQHLYLYDLDGNLIRALTSGAWMVVGDGGSRAVVDVDEAQGRVYFTANEQSPLERHLYSVPLRWNSAPKRITVEAGWHTAAVSPDHQFFLEVYSNPERPPRIQLRRIDGRLFATLIDNALDDSHPYAPYRDVHVRTEFGTLKAADGQTLYYQMLKPAHFDAAHKYPVIVDVYGGPGVQRVRQAWGGYPRSNEGFFRQILAQSGYVVFTLDNRGSGFRGVAFESVITRRLGQIEVADQVEGATYLRSLPFVDPKRIGVFGWSYGGYMALMCLFTAPDYFQAGVAGAPVTDWRMYDTHYTERYLGLPQQNASGYEASSVLKYADALRAPLLVIHGMADDNVLFSNSTKLFKRLQDLDKPFDMMTYPGGKHGLLRHADMGPHAYETIKRFFDENLKP